MRFLIALILLVALPILRWAIIPDLLTRGVLDSDEIAIEFVVTEQSYHNGSNYVISHGGYSVFSRDPFLFDLGDKIRVVGNHDRRVIMGKVARVYLYNPTISIVESGRIPLVQKIKIMLVNMRVLMTSSLENKLPQPHSGLAAGMLLGVRSSLTESFHGELVNTGTLHVVAASGYNVTMVMRVMMGILLIYLSRKWSILIGFVGVIVYVIIAGASAAVVRAAIMGILTFSAYFWGRPVEARRILWIVSYLMIIYNPLILADVGFQLSVVATASILYVEPFIRRFVEERNKWMRESRLGEYLAENLYPTLAAWVATGPIIWYHFGRVSWISPLANLLVLGLVPTIMVLAAVAISVSWVPVVGRVVAWMLYVPLELFVRVVRALG